MIQSERYTVTPETRKKLAGVSTSELVERSKNQDLPLSERVIALLELDARQHDLLRRL